MKIVKEVIRTILTKNGRFDTQRMAFLQPQLLRQNYLSLYKVGGPQNSNMIYFSIYVLKGRLLFAAVDLLCVAVKRQTMKKRYCNLIRLRRLLSRTSTS